MGDIVCVLVCINLSVLICSLMIFLCNLHLGHIYVIIVIFSPAYINLFAVLFIGEVIVIGTGESLCSDCLNLFFKPLSMVLYRWYVGNITRSHAEQMLMQNNYEDGCFIVRRSESAPGEFSITVRYNFFILFFCYMAMPVNHF